MPLFAKSSSPECVQHVPIPRIWTSSLLPFEARLERVLEPWRDTPYRRGQQCEGVGVDCVRFCGAVWDDLRGRPRTPIERLPHDMALNAPAAARAAMRALLEFYGPVDDVLDGSAQPGDALVTGVRGAGPGHVIIVGPRFNTIWQAASGRVEQGGWSLIERYQTLMHHFRFRDRASWPSS
jgi:cell wall-associated NlpC family hydrolase